MHVARHPVGVPADVEVCTVADPAPQLLAELQHPVLYVDLLRPVAGEGGLKPRQRAVLEETFELAAIEEVMRGAALTEEKPGLAPRAERPPFFQEGPKGRNACPGPDHHDRPVRILRQTETGVAVHVDRHGTVLAAPIRKESRGDALAASPVALVAH